MKNFTYYYINNNYIPNSDKQIENDIFKRKSLRSDIISNTNFNINIDNQIDNSKLIKDYTDKKQNLKKNKSQNFFYYRNTESNSNNSKINSPKIVVEPHTKSTRDYILYNIDKTITDTPLNYNYSYNYLSNVANTQKPVIKNTNYKDKINEIKTKIEKIIKKNQYRSTGTDIKKIAKTTSNQSILNRKNNNINNNNINEYNKKYDIKTKTYLLFNPINNAKTNDYINIDNILRKKNIKKNTNTNNLLKEDIRELLNFKDSNKIKIENDYIIKKNKKNNCTSYDRSMDNIIKNKQSNK